MASNTSLYGIRKPKTASKEISSSTSLAFSSTLTSLLSSSSTTSRPTSGRPRPSKHSKDDIFTSHNKNTKKRAARDLEDDSEDETQRGRGARRQDIGGVDEAVLHRSKRKLASKAKLYKEMKRGEHVAREGEDNEGLVDFDRKWAEGERSSGEDSDSDGWDDRGGEIVEYEDEYGRQRRGTKAEAERMERKKQNKTLGQEELDRISARPAMPEKLIYGDTVQSLAFNPDEPAVEKMEELARKRDRSLTPPEQRHYEADKEFRIKGVGFYSFSKDEGMRKQEMEALEAERLETERVRKEREEKKEARKREIEERRRAIGEKRAKKQADSFLDGLNTDLDKTDVT
ncbi:Uncharacterized protein BP5553_01987 [Venustampulla echinocandica]|uniref:Uncharacterized protein n=1 Tax=Venustampulla echinocandica TaxID=2656787 RepID=A0A370U2J8_9HELO|nr:Uncharacterized protein BP5553_01987 [Venustampulla echinocandica]RDL42008.1 Uncharacterized protein BP5553_01987 [Venustampulla echinocandica]